MQPLDPRPKSLNPQTGDDSGLTQYLQKYLVESTQEFWGLAGGFRNNPTIQTPNPKADKQPLDQRIIMRVLGRNRKNHLTPYTIHHTPYTLHHAPYTRRPSPYTLHPTPYTLHPTPYTLHPTSCTLHRTPCTLHPKP